MFSVLHYPPGDTPRLLGWAPSYAEAVEIARALSVDIEVGEYRVRDNGGAVVFVAVDGRGRPHQEVEDEEPAESA